MSTLPTRALSLYAPWAWAVLHLGKDIENRDWLVGRGFRHEAAFRGPFWIHASLYGGPTQLGLRRLLDEWEGVKTMAERAGARMPDQPVTLQVFLDMRGKIVGRASVVDAVTESTSGWFCGPVGLVLSDVQVAREPVKAGGALGFWRVPDDVLEKLRVAS